MNIIYIFFIVTVEKGEHWSSSHSALSRSFPALQAMDIIGKDNLLSPFKTSFQISQSNLQYPLKLSIPPYLHHFISVQGTLTTHFTISN